MNLNKLSLKELENNTIIIDYINKCLDMFKIIENKKPVDNNSTIKTIIDGYFNNFYNDNNAIENNVNDFLNKMIKKNEMKFKKYDMFDVEDFDKLNEQQKNNFCEQMYYMLGKINEFDIDIKTNNNELLNSLVEYMNVKISLNNANVSFANKIYEKDLEKEPSKQTALIVMRLETISNNRDRQNQELSNNLEIVKENILENNQKELKKDIENDFINR